MTNVSLFRPRQVPAVIRPADAEQGRLASLLAGSPHMLNVTSSSPHTSVVGNALERGVGLRWQRCDDIAGLEVVLADGTLLRLGSWPDAQGRVVPYRHELGPALMPLFAQSNFGVVTAAVIRLVPRPESLRLVRLSFGTDRLASAVDELRGYYGQRLISGVLKIFFGPTTAPCVAYCCVDGDRELVTSACSLLVRRARSAGLFGEVCELDLDLPERDVEGDRLLRCLAGDPSRNEAMLQRFFGVGTTGVDRDSDHGFLFFLPMLPFQGVAIADACELLRDIEAETGTQWVATVNAVATDLIDLVERDAERLRWAAIGRAAAQGAV